LAALNFPQRKQRICNARIYYLDLAYANTMTLKGVLTPVNTSHYYRPDGHPRPDRGPGEGWLLQRAGRLG
jgi:hypothetical protein